MSLRRSSFSFHNYIQRRPYIPQIFKLRGTNTVFDQDWPPTPILNRTEFRSKIQAPPPDTGTLTGIVTSGRQRFAVPTGDFFSFSKNFAHKFRSIPCPAGQQQQEGKQHKKRSH